MKLPFFIILLDFCQTQVLKLDLKTPELSLIAEDESKPIISENDLSENTTSGETSSKSIIIRKALKLTMRQGLIMNQMLSFYTMNNEFMNEQCKNHIGELKQSVRAFEPWALKMIDSSSKLPAGILEGNLVEFGNFKQCLNIYENTSFGTIIGKHCELKFHPPLWLVRKIVGYRGFTDSQFSKNLLAMENVFFKWSVCVPESCSHEAVLKHFNKTVGEITEGLELTASLPQEKCITKDDYPKFTNAQYGVIAFLASFVIVSTLAGIIDCCSNDNKNGLVGAFSFRANFRRITSNSENNLELECLHGMRCINTCWVLFGHRYLFSLYLPFVNGLTTFDWLQGYFSTMVLGGTVSVDTFFMMSGILVAIGFMEHVTKVGKFQLIPFYLYRYLRLTLPLALGVLFFSTLIQHFGDGPHWNDIYPELQEPCIRYWWSTLLHIQSYTNPKFLCILQTWSLTCDMLFFYTSPIILYPLWKRPTLGYIIWIILYLIAVFLSVWFAWINHYKGTLAASSMFATDKYFQEYYIVPHYRASTYFIGLAFGYFLFTTKGKKIKISTVLCVSGWCIAFSLMFVIIVWSHSFELPFHEYNLLESTLYTSVVRSVWTFCMVWIVWACSIGYGGIINDFLSSHIFKVLGKLSYGIYLFHCVHILVFQSSTIVPIYFKDYYMLITYLSDIFFMVIFGFIFSLFYEYPLGQLVMMLFKQRVKPAPKIQPQVGLIYPQALFQQQVAVLFLSVNMSIPFTSSQNLFLVYFLPMESTSNGMLVIILYYLNHWISGVIYLDDIILLQ